MFKLDHSKHPAESDLRSLIGGALGDHSLIDQARASGLDFATILALIVKYGPMAKAVIEAIIAALKTPVPTPTP